MKKQRSIASTITALLAIGVFGVANAWAQNGVIAFRDACVSRAYVMRGEPESASNPRVKLPLPPPINGFQLGSTPLDVSTSGPVTVLLNGLFAVQVNDIGGNLTPDAPVNIRLPNDPSLPADINDAFDAKFSGLADRVALTADGVLVVADVVRDVNHKIVGLTNPTVVANLLTIGSPSDSNISDGGITGFPDFSPDGTKIVVSIYSDLWLLDLTGDGHILVSAQPLTRTVDDSEFEAAFSPDGNTIAYVSGPNSTFRGAIFGPNIRSLNIFTLNLGTLEVTQVTTKINMLVGPEYPAWSPDGQFLAFMAQGSRPPRNSPCSGLVNFDIYELKADGTGTVIPLTNTVGTGVEYFPQWGW
jgi:WD40 repeat protein